MKSLTSLQPSTPPDSSSIDWHDTPELYSILMRAYDVNKARQIIKKFPRAITQLPIQNLNTGLHRVIEGTQVDLSIPVILISLEDTHWPIDGWHRIVRGKLDGLATLPCVILTKEETSKIQLR